MPIMAMMRLWRYSCILLLLVFPFPVASAHFNIRHLLVKPILETNKSQGNRDHKPIIKKFQEILKALSGNVIPSGPRIFQHTLYWLTCLDAFKAVHLNDYGDVRQQHVLYSKLFYFESLRPRLLYAVGALLRALQLCTPLQFLLDPTCGVGAGINVCAAFAGSRWVKPLVLGFATTRWVWEWLGARSVSKVHIPISVIIGKGVKDSPRQPEVK
jgi:hypothetical protein